MMPCFSFQNVNVMKGSLFEPFGSETVAPLWPRSLVRVYMQSKMGVLKLSRENGGLLPVWNWGGIFFWGGSCEDDGLDWREFILKFQKLGELGCFFKIEAPPKFQRLKLVEIP